MDGINFSKYGGIYYTDEIDFTEEIEAGIVVFTLDEALIGKRIDQVSARHVRPEIVMVRDKK